MQINKILFKSQTWPESFKLPHSYLDLIAKGLPNIDPWWWIAPHKDAAIYWSNILREQFPSRMLVPFAKDGGSDDIACFDGFDYSSDPKVLYIHSFCSPGWELRGEANNFVEWLRKAQDEAAAFNAEIEDE